MSFVEQKKNSQEKRLLDNNHAKHRQLSSNHALRAPLVGAELAGEEVFADWETTKMSETALPLGVVVVAAAVPVGVAVPLPATAPVGGVAREGVPGAASPRAPLVLGGVIVRFGVAAPAPAPDSKTSPFRPSTGDTRFGVMVPVPVPLSPPPLPPTPIPTPLTRAIGIAIRDS